MCQFYSSPGESFNLGVFPEPFSSRGVKERGWDKNSVDRVFAEQGWGPKFDLQHPHVKPGVFTIPGEGGMGGSLKPAGQLAWCDLWASDPRSRIKTRFGLICNIYVVSRRQCVIAIFPILWLLQLSVACSWNVLWALERMTEMFCWELSSQQSLSHTHTQDMKVWR